MLNYQDGTDALADRKNRRAGMWRELFGPSRAEQCRAAATAIGGEFVAGRVPGLEQIVVRLDPWVATLHGLAQTRGRSEGLTYQIAVPYVGTDRFRCWAVDSGFWSYAAALFGYRDVRVGDARFDDAYVLGGSDRAKVRAVFGDPVVMAVARRLMTVNLRVGGGAAVLNTTGEVGNVSRLRTRLDLCFAVVGRLAELGLVVPGEPVRGM